MASRVDKAADGLGPNLSLSKSGDLSDEDVTVTITTDEQLSSPARCHARPCQLTPLVMWLTAATMECVYEAVEDNLDTMETGDSSS